MHRDILLSSVAHTRSVATAVEFRRIWWNKHSSPSPYEDCISFWRPVPPPGYVALCDCMVSGVHAPPLVSRGLQLAGVEEAQASCLLADLSHRILMSSLESWFWTCLLEQGPCGGPVQQQHQRQRQRQK